MKTIKGDGEKYEDTPINKKAAEILGLTEKIASGNCIQCDQPFTKDNVFTDAGWRETKISHTCEKCFDAMFEDEEEGE